MIYKRGDMKIWFGLFLLTISLNVFANNHDVNCTSDKQTFHVTNVKSDGSFDIQSSDPKTHCKTK